MLQRVIELSSATFEAVKRVLKQSREIGRQHMQSNAGVTAAIATSLETVKRVVIRVRDLAGPHLRPVVSFSAAVIVAAVQRVAGVIPEFGGRRLRPVIAFVAGVTLMGGFAFIVWTLLSATEPEPRLIDGRFVNETTGWVARVDQESRLLQVSRTFLGFRREEFVVDREATIVIRDKEGGLGDLDQGMPVRVAWEQVGDTRRTLSIELVVADSATRRMPTPRPVAASAEQPRRLDAVPATQTDAPAALPAPGAPPVLRAEPAPPAQSISPAVAPTSHPALPASAAVRPEVAQPSKPDSLAAAPMLDPTPVAPDARKARRPGVARTSPPAVESVEPRESAVPRSAPSPTDASGLDGSDAIDWLLENSRRR